MVEVIDFSDWEKFDLGARTDIYSFTALVYLGKEKQGSLDENRKKKMHILYLL